MVQINTNNPSRTYQNHPDHPSSAALRGASSIAPLTLRAEPALHGAATARFLHGAATAPFLHGAATAAYLHGAATAAFLHGAATAADAPRLQRAASLELSGRISQPRSSELICKHIQQRLGEELGLLFLARPAGQSVLIPAGRPAIGVCMSYVRPAGFSLGFGRPADRPPGYLCIGVVFVAGWLSGCAFNWLRSWPAGRPADGWLYLQLAKVLAGRLAGCLASWLAGTLTRLVGLATWFRILVKIKRTC